jgi:virulence factor Mce-like protein
MRPGHGQGIQNWQIGLIAIAAVVIGFYLAFAKSLPFAGDGYTVKAVFSDAQSLRAKSPVRIAGVQVGEVTEVEHVTDSNGNGLDAAMVTMKISDEGRPIKEDAAMTLRPRLFLEGNLFVDVQPGSPGAEELESGSIVPIDQTSISVQFDQVLTTLQDPVRDDLQIFLKEFGDALDRYGGAEGFRESFRTSPAAYKYTSQVNEAFLGTEPGDLAGVIVNLDRVARALNQSQVQLQDLVTNLRVVTGSFAAESASLETAIAELPRALEVGRPALAKLNSSFPALRAFSREALPGVKAADRALPDAIPWIFQLRKLVSRKELRGLVKDLRPTIPKLARLARASLPFLEEARALSSCFNNVVIPWSNTTVPNATAGLGIDPPAKEVYKETGYGLVGIAGESRSGDPNGQYIRVAAGGGTNTIVTPPIPGINGPGPAAPSAGTLFAPIQGAEPQALPTAPGTIEPYIKTPFRPDLPCENQDPPILNSNLAPAPPGQTSTSSNEAGMLPEQLQPFATQQGLLLRQLQRANEMIDGGRKAKGRVLLRETLADLKAFYRTDLREYRAISRGLDG